MDGDGKGPGERRKPRTTVLLWGIAAALALIACVMDTIENGRVSVMKAVLAGSLTLLAFATYRRLRRP